MTARALYALALALGIVAGGAWVLDGWLLVVFLWLAPVAALLGALLAQYELAQERREHERNAAAAENMERALRAAGLEILRGRYLELGLQPPAWLEHAVRTGEGFPVEPRRVRVELDADGRRRRVVVPPELDA